MNYSIRIFFIGLFILTGLNAYSIQPDTSAYQLQRVKINNLLAERSSRFGQYDLSLSARTGIFGLQTKNDLKNSNEILRSIILNDNNIFRELKVLMNYKDQEVSQAQNISINNRKRIEAYMLTIKKLQDQNESLKVKLAAAEKDTSSSSFFYIVLGLLLLTSIIYILILVRKIRKISQPNFSNETTLL